MLALGLITYPSLLVVLTRELIKCKHAEKLKKDEKMTKKVINQLQDAENNVQSDVRFD